MPGPGSRISKVKRAKNYGASQDIPKCMKKENPHPSAKATSGPEEVNFLIQKINPVPAFQRQIES
jgi:hypothetical protein